MADDTPSPGQLPVPVPSAPGAEPGGTVRSRRRRFSLFAKIALIGLLGNLPIAYVAYLHGAYLEDEVTVASRELDGANYLVAAWPLYQASLLDRSPSAAAVESFREAAVQYDATLLTQLYSQRVLDLRGAPGIATVNANEDLLGRIADNAGLGLRGDVSLQDAALIVADHLPAVARAAYVLMADLTTGSRSMSPQAAILRFEHAGDLLRDALGATDALNFDTEMTARMSDAQRTMNAAAAAFTAAVQSVTMVPNGDLAGSYAAFQVALSDFWLVSADALSSLLAIRIELAASRLRQDISIVAGVYLTVITLIALLFLPINRRMRRLKNAVEQMQAGRLDVPVTDHRSNDEIEDVARAVEGFRLDLIDKRIADDALQQRNADLQQQRYELEVKNVRFDETLNSMSHGLAMFDNRQRLTVWNRQFAELFDLSNESLAVGQTLDDVAGRSFRRGAIVALDRGRQKNVAGKLDYHLELEDGRIFFVSSRKMRDGGVVITHEDITERRLAEMQIAHLAHHDALTKLPNRVHFTEDLDAALRQRRPNEQVAVLHVDLDQFKGVNDVLGHPLGDLLLQTVAERLQRLADERLVAAARLSGDEFALVAWEIDSPRSAEALAARVVAAIGEPIEIDGSSVDVSACVGVALAPQDGTSSTDLMRNAELALFRAKSDGRGVHRFFERGLDAEVRARRELETDLRAALGRGEFDVAYQPVIELARDRVIGFEALLRWKHPVRGDIPPSVFIPVAEETGLIVPLGEWVLRQACLAAHDWPAEIKIAVNLSPVQFKGRNLVATVMNALSATELAPARLELEITESVLLANDSATIATLHQLRGLGVRISLDDFGTGFSSLSYLRSFPFDKIKMDQTFVRGMVEDKDGIAIVRAVAGLGNGLRMTTTAEGVETPAQLDLLRAEGYDEVQGFLFGQPVPSAMIDDILRRYGWPEIGDRARASA